MKIKTYIICFLFLLFFTTGLVIYKHGGETLTVTTYPQTARPTPSPVPEALFDAPSQLQMDLEGYLNAKNSPLADDVAYLLTKDHWQLLVGVSAIESQFCKRMVNNNCWGINTTHGYAKFATLRDAMDATDALITKWQNKGRWLTVEDMNCSYVVPCSGNWVRVVEKTLDEMYVLEHK